MKSGKAFYLKMVVTPGSPQFSSNILEYMSFNADEDYVCNFDRVNYPMYSASWCTTNANGEVTYPALIPGATYRFVDNNPRPVVKQEFVAESGKLHDMGNITIHVSE